MKYLSFLFLLLLFGVSSCTDTQHKVAPIEEELRVLAEAHHQGEVRTHARSLLIKLGKMNMDQLFEQKTIDARHKTYLNRVRNYMGKTP